METISLLGEVTPNKMIEVKYDRAKLICSNIWDNPDKFYFEDIFHDTIYRCLIKLGNGHYDTDFLKNYFFKAFRINMIRHYGYSYNKLKSGIEIADVLIPVSNNIETHMDGFAMLDYVERNHGKDIRDMLWDNYTGMTYKELDKKYNVNTYYYLSKLKDELKRYYLSNYDTQILPKSNESIIRYV